MTSLGWMRPEALLEVIRLLHMPAVSVDPACEPRGYELRRHAATNNDQAGSEDIGSDSHPSCFSLDGFVFDRDRERIAQDAVRIGKRHAMLAQIGRVLRGIE